MDRQERLIEALNPVIRGWSNYFSTVCSRETFEEDGRRAAPPTAVVEQVSPSEQAPEWGQQQYWRREDGRLHFTPRGEWEAR